MGRDLYTHFPNSSKLVIDEAEEALGGGLKALMFSGPSADLRKTDNAQPAILACSIATLRALEHEYGFDIEKEASFVLGHSLGEYTALVAAKSLPLSTAIRLVRARGAAMSTAMASLKAESAMVAMVVHLPAASDPSHAEADDVVEKRLMDIETCLGSSEVVEGLGPEDVVEISNINSSYQFVLSGTASAVNFAARVLQSADLAHRAADVPVSAPFHSRLLLPAALELRPLLRSTEFAAPVVPFVSNVTARPVTNAAEIPDLLERQVTATVQWHRSVRWARREGGVGRWACMGPGRVIANLVRKEFGGDVVRPIVTYSDVKAFGEQMGNR